MLVCFDYDGVLVDSLKRWVKIAREVQRSMGEGRAPAVNDFRNLATTTTVKNLGRTLGISAGHLSEFEDKVFEALRASEEVPPLYPEMDDLVRQASKVHQIAIITASLGEEIDRIVAANHFGDCISKVLDGTDRRPKSQKLAELIQFFKTAPSETCLVGDTCTDIAEGKRVGVRTIAVTWGFHTKKRLLQEDPDFIVDCPAELLRILVDEHLD